MSASIKLGKAPLMKYVAAVCPLTGKPTHLDMVGEPIPRCKVQSCTKPIYTEGTCYNHYQDRFK